MKEQSDAPTPETEAALETAHELIDFGGCEDWCTATTPCHSCDARKAVYGLADVARRLERERDRYRKSIEEALHVLDMPRAGQYQKAIDVSVAKTCLANALAGKVAE